MIDTVGPGSEVCIETVRRGLQALKQVEGKIRNRFPDSPRLSSRNAVIEIRLQKSNGGEIGVRTKCDPLKHVRKYHKTRQALPANI